MDIEEIVDVMTGGTSYVNTASLYGITIVTLKEMLVAHTKSLGLPTKSETGKSYRQNVLVNQLRCHSEGRPYVDSRTEIEVNGTTLSIREWVYQRVLPDASQEDQYDRIGLLAKRYERWLDRKSKAKTLENLIFGKPAKIKNHNKYQANYSGRQEALDKLHRLFMSIGGEIGDNKYKVCG